MRGLIRRPTRFRGPTRSGEPDEPRDHGAVSAIVAIVLSVGLVFGMGALVIDIGLLYSEKEQLQSGADAASWKVAQACVATPANCTAALQTPNAQAYAVKNARDGYADAQICLNGTGCPVWNTATTCPPAPAATGHFDYVEVRTSTRNPNGTTLVPPVFAKALIGGTYHGKKVGACARVVWGVPASASVLALGISKCDWERITTKGTTFYGLPLLDPLLQQTGVYSLLGLSTPTDNAITINNPALSWCHNAWDLTSPSGYAWLGTPNAACRLAVTPTTGAVETWINSLTLTFTSATNCTNALRTARDQGVPVLVPIFDKVIGAIVPLPATYRIIGFAPFVVTGWTGLLGGILGAVSSLTNTVPAIATLLCGAQLCIYGYFTKAVVPQRLPTTFGTGNNYGVTVIGRTG